MKFGIHIGAMGGPLGEMRNLSNGRVDCGLGARWHDIEAKAFGCAFPSIGPREDMLEEYAQIMRLLLDPEAEVVREDSTPAAATVAVQ